MTGQTSLPWGGSTIGDAPSLGNTSDMFSEVWRAMVGATVYGATAKPNRGIVPGAGNELALQPKSPASMQVDLLTGEAFVHGTWYKNSSTQTFTLDANSSGNPRIDTIILRKSWVDQTIRAAVLKGTPAATPTAAALTQTDLVTWEIPLWYIYIANLAGSVDTPNFTDMREMAIAGGDVDKAIRRAIFPVGKMDYFMETAQALEGGAWLRLDGLTIGNPSSGATGRANVDMLSLFTHIWNKTSNTYFPIQDSSGAGTTRGASAQADWEANKRLPIGDARGRAVAAMDDPSGSLAANRMTNTAWDNIGGAGGAETVAIDASTTPNHNHAGRIAGTSSGWGAYFHLAVAFEGYDLYYPPSGATIYSDPYGSSGAHANLQPTVVLGNWYIYTGN